MKTFQNQKPRCENGFTHLDATHDTFRVKETSFWSGSRKEAQNSLLMGDEQFFTLLVWCEFG